MDAHVSSILSYRGAVETLPTLSPENIFTSTSQKVLLAHCELDTQYGIDKINEKIESDINQIEKLLSTRIEQVINEIKFLKTTIAGSDLSSPKLNDIKEGKEKPVSRVEKLFMCATKLLRIVEKTSQFYYHYKESYKDYSSIVRVGGYRSLCICLLESFEKVSKKLSKVASGTLELSTRKKKFYYHPFSSKKQSNDDLVIDTSNRKLRSSASLNHDSNISDSSSGSGGSGIMGSLTNSLRIPMPQKKLTHRRSRSNVSNRGTIGKSTKLAIKEIQAELEREEKNEKEESIEEPIVVNVKDLPKDKEEDSSEEKKELEEQEKESGENEFYSKITQYYNQKRENTRGKYEREIESLNLVIMKLKKDMEEQLNHLNEAEKKAKERLNSAEQTAITDTEIPTQFCTKSFAVLTALISRLNITKNIPSGEVFKSLDDLYKKSPDEDPHSILVVAHFGYEIDKSLIEYSKKMKVVYCAVYDSFSVKNRLNPAMVQRMRFSASAAYYMLSSKGASDKYGSLRKGLDVSFVRDVWDLLEDPVTSFFATNLGFAPSVERMKTNCIVRIPVSNRDIYPDGKEMNYRIRVLYISPFLHTASNKLSLNINSRAAFSDDDYKPKGIITNTLYKPVSAAKNVSKLFKVFEGDNSSKFTSNTIIIHIHGGGWVSQSPDQHLPYLSEWAKVAKLPAISIDYSLAPEKSYPVCVNECYAIYKWFQNPENCKLMGLPIVHGKPIRAIVCGDSAGGNLSCAITVKAIQDKILPPVGLLLHYPAVNLNNDASLSRMIFSHDPILNLETMQCVLDCYLGKDKDKSGLDPLISPLFAPDEILSKFPNTVISVGDVDPLIDDSTALFRKLEKLKVRSILRIFGSLPHGYLNLPTQLPKARIAISEAATYMKWLKEEHLKTELLPEVHKK